MQAQKKLSNKPLNYFVTPSKNIIYGAALTLAWKELINKIIKENIKINSEFQDALQITRKFNQSKVSLKDLTPSCYYATAGFGNETVNRINSEVKQKFPDKSTPPIQANLTPVDIIAYAYFLKNLKFPVPFEKRDVYFKKVKVPGFIAKSPEHKKQVLVHHYESRKNFVAELLTKEKNQQVFLVRCDEEVGIQQISSYIKNHSNVFGSHLEKHDIFQMPKIDISVKHNVNQLKNIFLANQKFQAYYFSQIFEIVKLKIDETGVKVENEGVIKMLRSAVRPISQPKQIILDGPFWIAMRQKGKEEYFIAKINELNEKIQ